MHQTMNNKSIHEFSTSPFRIMGLLGRTVAFAGLRGSYLLHADH